MLGNILARTILEISACSLAARAGRHGLDPSLCDELSKRLHAPAAPRTAGQLLLISTARAPYCWRSRSWWPLGITQLGLATPLLSAWLTGQPTPRDAGKTLLAASWSALASASCWSRSISRVCAGAAACGPDQGRDHRGGSSRRVARISCIILRRPRRGDPDAARPDVDAGLDYSRGFSPPRRALSPGVFWTANILTAVIFGLGHLPATAPCPAHDSDCDPRHRAQRRGGNRVRLCCFRR